MNTLLIGYCRIAWLGLVLHLGFAIPALVVAPDGLIHIFNVLPAFFVDNLPGNGEAGDRSTESMFEEGYEHPVGLAEWPIGYRSAGSSCIPCHNGTLEDRNLTINRPGVIPNTPSFELAGDASQWALSDRPANSTANSDTLLPYIDPFTDGSPTQHMVYKHLIIPFAKKSPM
ncbi:hypothetical protein [Spirosoma pulveris]